MAGQVHHTPVLALFVSLFVSRGFQVAFRILMQLKVSLFQGSVECNEQCV